MTAGIAEKLPQDFPEDPKNTETQTTNPNRKRNRNIILAAGAASLATVIAVGANRGGEEAPNSAPVATERTDSTSTETTPPVEDGIALPVAGEEGEITRIPQELFDSITPQSPESMIIETGSELQSAIATEVDANNEAFTFAGFDTPDITDTEIIQNSGEIATRVRSDVIEGVNERFNSVSIFDNEAANTPEKFNKLARDNYTLEFISVAKASGVAPEDIEKLLNETGGEYDNLVNTTLARELFTKPALEAAKLEQGSTLYDIAANSIDSKIMQEVSTGQRVDSAGIVITPFSQPGGGQRYAQVVSEQGNNVIFSTPISIEAPILNHAAESVLGGEIAYTENNTYKPVSLSEM